MPEYYTFIREDDADGISYDFATTTHLYSVVFSIEMYQPYLDDFPNLLSQGYEFSFFRRQHTKKRKESNHLVKGTIFKIIESHYEEQGIETVLLYRCDTSDGLEKTRANTFDTWYSAEDSHLNTFLIKESLQVVVPEKDGTAKTYYIGYIAHKDNPKLEDVQAEFDLFAYYLTSFQK